MAWHTLAPVVCFPLTVLYTGRANDVNADGTPRSSAHLLTLYWGLMIVNCMAKKLNISLALKDGGGVDAVIMNLAERGARKVKKRMDFFTTYLAGDPEMAIGKYLNLATFSLILVMALPIWLPPLVNSDIPLAPNPKATAVYCFGLLLQMATLNTSAFSTTFTVFFTSAYALRVLANDFVDYVDEVYGGCGDYLASEDGDEEALIGSAAATATSTNANANKIDKLTNVIQRFNVLKSTTRAFSKGFEVFYLIAEATLIPASTVGYIIMYSKVTSPDDWDARDGCVVFMVSFLTIFCTVIIGAIFYHGVAITTALERATHAVEEMKGNEWLNVASGEDMYLNKLERFAKIVKSADLGFTPFKIRIESRLALTILYIVVSIAVTVYIEIGLG
jgi:hypothetical protein